MRSSNLTKLMNRREIREKVETALQDEENRHWSDREINRFIDDTLIEFTRIARHPQVEGISIRVVRQALERRPRQVRSQLMVRRYNNFSSPHGYSEEMLLLYLEQDLLNTMNPSILVPSTTTITYKVNFGSLSCDSSVSVFRIGPTYTIPSTIAEINSVSINGRELAIYTESQLNAAASSRGSRHYNLESSMGFHPNAFSSAVNNVDNTPKWREQHGPIEAVIFNNRTSSTFRIYPLPKADIDLYEDKDATAKVFLKLKVRGVPKATGLATDTTEPAVNLYWHEALVYGTIERCWMKEGKVQNVEKAQMYRGKLRTGSVSLETRRHE